MGKPITCTAVVFLLLISVMSVQADPLATLRPEHPRLMASNADFERIRALVHSDDLAKQWHVQLKERAEAMLDDPVTRYRLPDGRRLLYESRRVKGRVLTLGMLDRIAPDDRYRDRIWADLEAAAKFDHWNPDHFLDVAEMAFAFAIAYDWLHDRWTPEQRATIRAALVRHAIKPGLKAYADGAWWTRTRINWNQVCNGGLITAALAIGDDEPELSRKMLERSLASLPLSMRGYAPDGGYEEGPGYWGFGTIYNVFAIAALDSALGKDFGLSAMPGFDKTANFPLHMTGATGRGFNFGDNGEKPVYSPAMLYLAKRFDQPGKAYEAVKRSRGSALDLLWYDPELVDGDVPVLPESVVYQSAGVAAVRSGWHKETDWYIGAKGGWLGFGHAQMDLGSFILERGGVRWLIDLGADDYNLPGYFASQDGGKRWAYYRNRAEGHNTLVINPGKKQDQHYDAKASIACKDHTIKIDLSEAYRAGQVHREIRFESERDWTRVIDTLDLKAPGEVWWFAHTRARVEIAEDGRTAVLRQDGKAMRAEIASPKDAVFRLMDARPLPGSPDPKGQNPNNGAKLLNAADSARFVERGKTPRFGEPDPARAVRKLAIRLDEVRQTTIEVRFTPLHH